MNKAEYYQANRCGVVEETLQLPRFGIAVDLFRKKGCREILGIGGNEGRFASLITNDPAAPENRTRS